MKGLAGQVAVVTGASRGIGKGIAKRLLEENAVVAMIARDEERLSATREDLLSRTGREPSAAVAVPADVTDPAQVRRVFDECERAAGLPTLLVNDVGRADRKYTLAEIDEEALLFSYRANVLTSVLTTQEFVRRLGAAGRPGAIVNIGSSAGYLPKPGRIQYTGAKAGLIGITKALAGELAPLGIRINMVCPGPTLTENQQKALEDPERRKAEEPRIRKIPMRRMGEVEEMASAVAFLLSNDASFITGVILPVDGGYTLGQ